MLATLIVVPLQACLLCFTKGPKAYYIPRLWHASLARILGIKTEFTGSPVSDSQVFFVGNHLSHFDIFILGSKLRASFVAKSDLEKSPLINFLCKLQQTAFISRSSSEASKASHSIRNMLDEGKSVILFPEGTSTRGETVLDFKSTLFAVPIEYAERNLRIQPFTILVQSVDGKTHLTRELRDLYAWDRDNPIEMGAHILNFSKLKGARIKVVFHDPVTIHPEEDRKALAARIREMVASPLEQSSPSV